MSDSNIGSRKNRNINDHLLIMHGIVNAVVKGNEECIDIQVFDLEKAFDSLWLEDCMNDMYDSLMEENRNEKLALLYMMNHKNLVGIRTREGLTERINTPDIVQQGGKFGPTLCSNHVDSTGRKCQERNECFL